MLLPSWRTPIGTGWRNRGEPGLQRELFMAGVETRYQVNIQGKNSSDMVIARDIQSMLEQADARSDTLTLSYLAPAIVTSGRRFNLRKRVEGVLCF